MPAMSPAERSAMMGLPIVGLGLMLGGACILKGESAVTFLLITGIGGFVGAGKRVIVGGAVQGAPVGVWGLSRPASISAILAGSAVGCAAMAWLACSQRERIAAFLLAAYFLGRRFSRSDVEK